MCADCDIRLIMTKIAYERIRIQAVKRGPDWVVFSGIIQIVIQPAENFRSVVDKVDVGLGIEMTKDLIRILEHVKMLNIGREVSASNRLFNCLRGTQMARPRAG